MVPRKDDLGEISFSGSEVVVKSRLDHIQIKNRIDTRVQYATRNDRKAIATAKSCGARARARRHSADGR